MTPDTRPRVKVLDTRMAWEHPEGEYRIHRLTITDETGQRETVSTYNDYIAEPGWTGTVQLYLNKKGDLMAKPWGRLPKPDEDSHYNKWSVFVVNAITGTPVVRRQLVPFRLWRYWRTG